MLKISLKAKISQVSVFDTNFLFLTYCTFCTGLTVTGYILHTVFTIFKFKYSLSNSFAELDCAHENKYNWVSGEQYNNRTVKKSGAAQTEALQLLKSRYLGIFYVGKKLIFSS